MEAKTYSVKRDGKPPVSVTGFPKDRSCEAFINLKVGDSFGGEFQMMLYMADARALSAALGNAIDYAEARAVEAADLGLLDEAA
mgnify:CR=1 FL=1